MLRGAVESMGKETNPVVEPQGRALDEERMARLAHELNAPLSLIAGSLANLDHCLASLQSYFAAHGDLGQTNGDLERVPRGREVGQELATAADLLGICREGVERIRYLSRAFGRSAVSARAASSEGMLSLAAVVRRAVVFASAARNGAEAAIELDLQETPALAGDVEALSAVFINLIVNALDAVAGRQNGLVRVSVRYDSGRNAVEAHVCDNGPGIDAANQDRIFESHYTTKLYGAGLGLAIAREALEQHGGSIDVLSHDGPGTEFVVRLPLHADGDDTDRRRRGSGFLG